jgi:cation diffusion facilitator family transporter
MKSEGQSVRKYRSPRGKSAQQDPCEDLELCAKCSEKIMAWTILSNMFLIVISLTGGLLSGSAGLLADGTHSICGLIGSCVVATSVRLSKKKNDGDFPFGYGKLELVVSLSVYSVLFGLGIFVSISSLVNMITNPGHSPSLIGLPVSLVSILIVYMQYRYNSCAGRQLKSWSIKASAQNSKADLLTTAAVCTGIIFSQFGPSFAIFDSLAALLVGVVIIKDSVGLWMADLKLLLDQLPEPGFREKVVGVASEVFSGPVHLLKPKRLGRQFWVGLSLPMPEEALIEDWEAVRRTIENRLREKIDAIGEVDFFLETGTP